MQGDTFEFLFGEYGLGLVILVVVGLVVLLTRKRRAAILATEEGRRLVDRMERLFWRHLLAFIIGAILTTAMLLEFGSRFDQQPHVWLILLGLWLGLSGIALVSIRRLFPVPDASIPPTSAPRECWRAVGKPD